MTQHRCVLHHIPGEPKPGGDVTYSITEHTVICAGDSYMVLRPYHCQLQTKKMEIIPEINLRETFRSFVEGICSDSSRVLDEKQLPDQDMDTDANRRDIYMNVVPFVVQNLVDSPYFREFKHYVRVEPMEASGVMVQVTTDTGRICGWKCMDSTSERAFVYLRDGDMTYDYQERPSSGSPSVSSDSYVQCVNN